MNLLFRIKLYYPAIIWGLIIIVLSGYPGKQIPKVTVLQFDKLIHTLMYLILSFCLLLPFSIQLTDKKKRLKLGCFVVLFGVFYGGFMEVLQKNIFINRSGDWYDFFANSLGALLGVLFYSTILKILPINRWFKIK